MALQTILLETLSHAPRHILCISAVRRQVHARAGLFHPGTATSAPPFRALSSSTRQLHYRDKRRQFGRPGSERTSQSETLRDRNFEHVVKGHENEAEVTLEKESQLLHEAQDRGDATATRRHQRTIEGIWLGIEDTARSRHIHTEFEALAQVLRRKGTTTQDHVQRVENLTSEIVVSWTAEIWLAQHDVLAGTGLMGIGKRLQGIRRLVYAVTLGSPACLLHVAAVKALAWFIRKELKV